LRGWEIERITKQKKHNRNLIHQSNQEIQHPRHRATKIKKTSNENKHRIPSSLPPPSWHRSARHLQP
jgi:hypothetical protein